VRIKPEPFLVSQEFPWPSDGIRFEIVSEGPVSEHLEECQMRVVPDIVDISGSDALLHIRDPFPERMTFSEEIWYKRLHPGSIKKHRRVVLRNERRGRDNGMGLGFEKFQVFGADFGGSNVHK